MILHPFLRSVELERKSAVTPRAHQVRVECIPHSRIHRIISQTATQCESVRARDVMVRGRDVCMVASMNKLGAYRKGGMRRPENFDRSTRYISHSIKHVQLFLSPIPTQDARLRSGQSLRSGKLAPYPLPFHYPADSSISY